nr:uncharacterized protein LOC125182074 [Anser cygnoides]
MRGAGGGRRRRGGQMRRMERGRSRCLRRRPPQRARGRGLAGPRPPPAATPPPRHAGLGAPALDPVSFRIPIPIPIPVPVPVPGSQAVPLHRGCVGGKRASLVLGAFVVRGGYSPPFGSGEALIVLPHATAGTAHEERYRLDGIQRERRGMKHGQRNVRYHKEPLDPNLWKKEKSFGAARQSRKTLLPSNSLHTEEAQASTTNTSSVFFWVAFYCLPVSCCLASSGNHPSCGRVLCQDRLPFSRSLQGHIQGPKQGRCRGVRAAVEIVKEKGLA